MSVNDLTNQSISGSYTYLMQYSASNDIFSAYGEKISTLNITSSYSKNTESSSFANMANIATSASISNKSIYANYIASNTAQEKELPPILIIPDNLVLEDTFIFINSNNIENIVISGSIESSSPLTTQVGMFYISTPYSLTLQFDSNIYTQQHKITAGANTVIKLNYSFIKSNSIYLVDYEILTKE